jgi:hypothetical protein
MDKIEEMRTALRVAATALAIASDWHVEKVQCHPPERWRLSVSDNDSEACVAELKEGWCRTSDLARKLRELAED